MDQRDWTDSAEGVPSEKCDHTATTSTVTAGLERIVCETCSHVNLRYHDQGAFRPDGPTEHKPSSQPDSAEILIDLTDHPEPKPYRRCTACESRAVLLTPYGVACNKHTWIAVSKQELSDAGFWIPLLIDR